MIEAIAVDEWLYNTLAADNTLAALVAGRIYATVAPQTAKYPHVRFSEQSSTDTLGIDGTRILETCLFTVLTITDEPSWQGLGRQAADRVDELLHGASGIAGGTTIGTCHREQSLRYVDTVDTKQFRLLGGIYRINTYV